MFILFLHIFIATAMTGTTVGVIAAAHARRETRAYTAMLTSFAVTVASGVGLLVVSAGGIGRFCAMMSVFTAMTVVAHKFYQVRVISNSSL